MATHYNPRFCGFLTCSFEISNVVKHDAEALKQHPISFKTKFVGYFSIILLLLLISANYGEKFCGKISGNYFMTGIFGK